MRNRKKKDPVKRLYDDLPKEQPEYKPMQRHVVETKDIPAHKRNLQTVTEAIKKKAREDKKEFGPFKRMASVESPRSGSLEDVAWVSLSFESKEARDRCLKNKKFIEMMDQMIEIAMNTK